MTLTNPETCHGYPHGDDETHPVGIVPHHPHFGIFNLLFDICTCLNNNIFGCAVILLDVVENFCSFLV